jgi:hypothetical protein
LNEEISQVVQALRAKYPYQFHKSRFGVHITLGWLPRFVQLCDEVDQALGADKRGFHWDGCDEKFGTVSLGFGFHARKQIGIETRALLDPVMAKARADLKKRCVVCGQHGSADPSQGYMLTLCPGHRQERGESDFWVVVDSGSVYEACNALNQQREKSNRDRQN